MISARRCPGSVTTTGCAGCDGTSHRCIAPVRSLTPRRYPSPPRAPRIPHSDDSAAPELHASAVRSAPDSSVVELGSRRALGVLGGAYRGGVWRFALSRRWWVGHVLVVTFCAVFVRLGRWQWDRAQSSTGDWQNLGYALQWPLFAVVLVAAWARFLWLEQHRGPETESPQAETVEPETMLSSPTPPPVPRRPAYPPIREDDPDDELAAYNAYLAQLAEQDRR